MLNSIGLNPSQKEIHVRCRPDLTVLHPYLLPFCHGYHCPPSIDECLRGDGLNLVYILILTAVIKYAKLSGLSLNNLNVG